VDEVKVEVYSSAAARVSKRGNQANIRSTLRLFRYGHFENLSVRQTQGSADSKFDSHHLLYKKGVETVMVQIFF
jgi:hypothetical protein